MRKLPNKLKILTFLDVSFSRLKPSFVVTFNGLSQIHIGNLFH